MQPLELADKIYLEKRVTSSEGEVFELKSAIPSPSARALFDLIKGDANIKNTLEVGCAFGMSTLHICGALLGRPGAHHTIIDPFQYSNWHGIGIHNLNQTGIDFYDLIEQKSEFALPKLLENGRRFDFILIDGFHTFDHTLLDLFYANRLLRVGGYVAVDDSNWASIGRAVSFVANYPCYEFVDADKAKPLSKKKQTLGRLKRMVIMPLKLVIGEKGLRKLLHPTQFRKLFGEKYPRVAVLRKVVEDDRGFSWHDDFF